MLMIAVDVEGHIRMWQVDEARQQVCYTTTEGREFTISIEAIERQLRHGQPAQVTPSIK